MLLLNGKLLTGRDAAHKRMTDMLNRGEKLPVDFTDRFIYYVGPVDAVRDEAVGPAGPTTATRMDKFTRQMLEQTGLLGMIGKAERGVAAIDAIRDNEAVYLMAVGGAAYLVSKAIKHSRLLAFEDLGMEAIYEFDVVDMPVTVAVDAQRDERAQDRAGGVAEADRGEPGGWGAWRFWGSRGRGTPLVRKGGTGDNTSRPGWARGVELPLRPGRCRCGEVQGWNGGLSAPCPFGLRLRWVQAAAFEEAHTEGRDALDKGGPGEHEADDSDQGKGKENVGHERPPCEFATNSQPELGPYGRSLGEMFQLSGNAEFRAGRGHAWRISYGEGFWAGQEMREGCSGAAAEVAALSAAEDGAAAGAARVAGVVDLLPEADEVVDGGDDGDDGHPVDGGDGDEVDADDEAATSSSSPSGGRGWRRRRRRSG